MKNDKLKMKLFQKQAIFEFKKRVLTEFPSAKFILFGSVARGSDGDESDIDILVLVDRIVPSVKKKIYRISYEIELKKEIPISPVIEAKERWQKYEALEIPLCQEINKYGISL